MTYPAQKKTDLLEQNMKFVSTEKKPADHLDINSRFGYLAGESVNNNVICYLERHVEQFPERNAISWTESGIIRDFDGNPKTPLPTQQITYEHFHKLITKTARGLLDLGVEKGDRVILFLPMSVPMYTAMFAIMRIGAIAVFLDSWARRNHLGASANCVGPKAMISHKLAFDLVKEIPEFDKMPMRIIAGPGYDNSYTAQLEDLFSTDGEATICPVESETTALITFTTGSSGVPKGANRTHRFLCAQHEALWNVIPYTANDIDMPAFPIFSLNNLASGVTTLLPALDLSKPSEKDSAALAGQILQQHVTCTTISPSMFNGLSAFCRDHKISLISLRRVVTGGAPISKDNVQAFRSIAPNAEVWVLYGSTEVEPMAHIEAKEMLAVAADQDSEIIEEGVNVGHVSNELLYKFIQPTRENIRIGTTAGWHNIEVAPGQVGEFIVSGNHVCRDYYNNSEAFHKAKIVDPEGVVWHRTGDLGRMDENGYLWIVGRIHNMIIRDGAYYFPVGPEIILKRMDFIARGAYLALPDTQLGERCTVAVQLKDGASDIEAGLLEIQRLFKKNGFALDSFFVVEDIPMDPRHHSKVEYGVLREQLQREKIRDWLA
jgi:acyl-CoA synthetase (AMP-forming)/AMP-acid ligase II